MNWPFLLPPKYLPKVVILTTNCYAAKCLTNLCLLPVKANALVMREHWLFPPMNYGHFMTGSHFEHILKYLQFFYEKNTHQQIPDYVDTVNECTESTFVTGDTV